MPTLTRQKTQTKTIVGIALAAALVSTVGLKQ
jgi:hypothetical protein